jgi:hypothetical protein
MTHVSYQRQVSPDFHHVEWLELYGDGMLHECAIMKRTADGNVLYFRTADLDNIDKQRLAEILSNRNAAQLELWDLMQNITMRNGVNALTYFNQLVKLLTPSGKIVDPRAGQIGGRVAAPNQPVAA